MTRAPILTLDGLNPDRPFVRIRGVDYEMRVPDEFGLEERARLKKWYDRVLEWKEILDKDPDMPPEQAAEFSKMLRQFIHMTLIGLPDDLLWKENNKFRLTDAECFLLMQAFGEVVSENSTTAMETTLMEPLKTGVS